MYGMSLSNEKKYISLVIVASIILLGEFPLLQHISKELEISLSNTWLACVGILVIVITVYWIFWLIGALIKVDNELAGKIVRIVFAIPTGMALIIVFVFFIILLVNNGNIPQN